MRLVVVSLAALLVMGCGSKLKRLSEPERAQYEAVKVFMDEDQVKTYLKAKTKDERDALLKQLGLYDRYWSLDEERRDQIAIGDVQIGWTREELLMAWGKPQAASKPAGRPAEYSEMYLYRFEVQPDGAVLVWTPDSKTAYKAVQLYQLEVFVDDGRVTEMVKKDRWE